MSLFRAEDIAIRFGGIRAVDAVSFEVEQGEVFSIIGPNGAGKTTIFNLISRIYDPTSGQLFFDGQDITDVPPHQHRRPRHRAHVPEHRTVRQRDAAAEPADRPPLPFDASASCRSLRSCRRRAARRSQHREKVEEVIAFLGLQRYRDTLIANLPYGVRKVVELAARCAPSRSCCCSTNRPPA